MKKVLELLTCSPFLLPFPIEESIRVTDLLQDRGCSRGPSGPKNNKKTPKNESYKGLQS